MADDDYVAVRTKNFYNGDVYTGTWAPSGLPDGEGKYVWQDGSTYEGSWKGGAKHGVGRYTWPSGATYHGEWLEGSMHGVGSWESSDGRCRYQGGWLKDCQHGLGRQVYGNGDVYEGLWRLGAPCGPGRYVYGDGNEYDGEWRVGKMHGHGTFVWRSGERYDGEWKDGRMDGAGVFSSADGSTYDGHWRRGRKHGVGIFRPGHPPHHAGPHGSLSDGGVGRFSFGYSGGRTISHGKIAVAAAVRRSGEFNPEDNRHNHHNRSPFAIAAAAADTVCGGGGGPAGTFSRPSGAGTGSAAADDSTGESALATLSQMPSLPILFPSAPPSAPDSPRSPRMGPVPPGMSPLQAALLLNPGSRAQQGQGSNLVAGTSPATAAATDIAAFAAAAASQGLQPTPSQLQLLPSPFSETSSDPQQQVINLQLPNPAQQQLTPMASAGSGGDVISPRDPRVISHAVSVSPQSSLTASRSGSPAPGWSPVGSPLRAAAVAGGWGGGSGAGGEGPQEVPLPLPQAVPPGAAAGLRLPYGSVLQQQQHMQQGRLTSGCGGGSVQGAAGAGGVGGSSGSATGGGGVLGAGKLVFVRMYDKGRPLRETALTVDELEALIPGVLAAGRRGADRGAHGLMARLLRGGVGGAGGSRPRAWPRLGDTVTRAHSAYALMVALQLGIRYSVGRISHEPLHRIVSPDEYSLRVQQEFPRGGSAMTPVHPVEDFTWSDYAPVTFRRLRETFGVDASAYMLSLCSDQSLRHLASPGKSGSVFFLSQDERFFIKTMARCEMDVLLSMLPAYHRHVERHPHTLLCRFFGVHCVSTPSGKKYRFVVMSNIFRTPLQLHRKYDLKGSTLGRTAGRPPADDPTIIFKDLDLDLRLRLEDGWRDRLLFQLRADCGLLASVGVMDYSLLVGLHFRNRGPQQSNGSTGQDYNGGNGAAAAGPDGDRSTTGGTSGWPSDASVHQGGRGGNHREHSNAQQLANEYSRVEERIVRLRSRAGLGEAATGDLLELAKMRLLSPRGRGPPRPHPGASSTAGGGADDVSVNDTLALSMGQSRVQLGVNMAANAVHKDGREEEAVLWFALIDILQPYNTTKRLEHSLKSVIHASNSISVTHPNNYANRFQGFMKRVFE